MSDVVNKSLDRVHVALVGQLPPPVHGQSLAIQALVDASWDDIVIHPVRLDMSDSLDQVGSPSILKLLRLWRCARSSRRILKEYSPCVLYYPPGPGRFVPFLRDVLFLLATRASAAATVLHFHAGGVGAYVRRNGVRTFFSRVYRDADVAVQPGKSCPPDGAILGAKTIKIIPGGVPDPGVFATAPLPHATDPIRVLYVGHLTREKGFDLVPAIARRLAGVAELHIVGEWASAAYRREMEPQLALPNVAFHGGCYGAEKWRLFELCSVLLFPSFRETQGLVAVEAMACGMPVIASDIDGIRDVVVDGDSGVLVSPGNVDGFANAIGMFLEDRDYWNAMSVSARERYVSCFMLDTYLAEMRQVFKLCAMSERWNV